MSTVLNQHFNAIKETVYGTAVAATNSYAINSEGITGAYDKSIISTGMKAAYWGTDPTRITRNPKGAGGDISLDWETKGFIFWLTQMFGGVTLGVTPTGGVYTHTYALDDLKGKSFTAQSVRAENDGTLVPYTWTGCKVVSWELANSVDSYLSATITVDAQSEKIGAGAGALATQSASYQTGQFILSFLGGTVTVDGSAVRLTNYSLKVDHNIKTDRYALANSGLKAEPLQSGLPTITWTATAEFNDLVLANKAAATLNSGSFADVVATWTSPVAETGGGFSSLSVETPSVLIDKAEVTTKDQSLHMVDISGTVVGQAPIALTQVTPDAT